MPEIPASIFSRIMLIFFFRKKIYFFVKKFLKKMANLVLFYLKSLKSKNSGTKSEKNLEL